MTNKYDYHQIIQLIANVVLPEVCAYECVHGT